MKQKQNNLLTLPPPRDETKKIKIVKDGGLYEWKPQIKVWAWVMVSPLKEMINKSSLANSIGIGTSSLMKKLGWTDNNRGSLTPYEKSKVIQWLETLILESRALIDKLKNY